MKRVLPRSAKRTNYPDFRLPLCEKCGAEAMLGAGRRWFCAKCDTVKLGGSEEETTVHAIVGNRAQRRARGMLRIRHQR